MRSTRHFVFYSSFRKFFSKRLQAECCDANGQKNCADEFYELVGIICTENNISVAQNVTEALLVYERLLTLIREI